MSTPEQVVDIECETGEGPLWHPEDERLYWCDIPKGRVYRYDPAVDDYECVYRDDDERIGGFTIQRDGSLLLFQEAGAVRRLSRDNWTTETVVAPDPDRFHERFKRRHRGPRGEGLRRRHAGHRARPPGAALPAGHRRIVHPRPGVLRAPERDGIHARPVAPVLHRHLRSRFVGTGYIYRYDYNFASGRLSDPEVFVDASDIDGYPDGLTVDGEGHVWSAFWDGGALHRFAPDGAHERTVAFDPRKVSSLTFAGDSYDTAYVTTACVETRETEGAGAGSLYRVDLGVTGRPEFRSAVDPDRR